MKKEIKESLEHLFWKDTVKEMLENEKSLIIRDETLKKVGKQKAKELLWVRYYYWLERSLYHRTAVQVDDQGYVLYFRNDAYFG